MKKILKFYLCDQCNFALQNSFGISKITNVFIKIPLRTGDIEQFTPPLQFPRFVIFVEIAFSEIWSLLAISTFCNFNRRAERAGEKMLCNFNVFAISTFPKSLERSNFHAVAISTFSDLHGVCNFYGLQFPHARGARKRKIAHLVCLYKAETTSRPPQARKN